MNGLQVFSNEVFGSVRVVNIENEVWFVGKDVVECLGYKLSKAHTYGEFINKYVDKDDVFLYDKNSPHGEGVSFDYKELGQRGGYLINEYGVIELVLQSPLPQAKQFKRWVTHEVIPQIMKTGGYIPMSQEDDESTIMAKALLIAQKTIEQKDVLIKQQTEQIAEMTPKASVYDKFLDSTHVFKSTQLAKLYHMSSAKALNQVLNEHHICYKQGNSWLPYITTDQTWYKVVANEWGGGHH